MKNLHTLRMTLLLCTGFLALMFSGCSKVEPWQKSNLARSHMAFDPDRGEARYTKKAYVAKEGSSGGYGVGGGGCGCN
jgi:hypothetical protein